MKLKRFDAELDHRTSSYGRWASADGAWGFVRLEGRWVVLAALGSPGAPSVPPDILLARKALLKQAGIDRDSVSFKTRREAVAALDLLLAGLPEGATGS